jgi:hypothetical protein
LDCLGRELFLVKSPDSRGWICLDFLGFSRPNRDFSMGYADKTRENFSRRLLALETRKARVQNHRDCRIVHVASVMHFLFFCKNLPSEGIAIF